MRRAVAVLGLLLGGSLLAGALAQESPSFKLEEHRFNAGGTPKDGAELTSASFHLSLSAIGQGVMPAAITSTSFSMSGSFVGTYPPPGEATNLLFTDTTTVVWDAEPSVGVYNLYEGKIADPGDDACSTDDRLDIATSTTSVSATPAPGEVLRVLVTAENRLGEEGPLGSDSDGTARANAPPCP